MPSRRWDDACRQFPSTRHLNPRSLRTAFEQFAEWVTRRNAHTRAIAIATVVVTVVLTLVARQGRGEVPADVRASGQGVARQTSRHPGLSRFLAHRRDASQATGLLAYGGRLLHFGQPVEQAQQAAVEQPLETAATTSTTRST